MWESKKELEGIFTLMIRHMNDIAATLMEQPEYFEALFQERVVKGKTYTIVDEWCEGYLRGVALAAEQWDSAGQDMAVLLAPIRAFTGATRWRGHDLDRNETEKLQQAIEPSVREIHAYWLVRRSENESPMQPVRRQLRVGRNDPCPCGSGKKYKKCCLH